jgi:hypothetical protein
MRASGIRMHGTQRRKGHEGPDIRIRTFVSFVSLWFLSGPAGAEPYVRVLTSSAFITKPEAGTDPHLGGDLWTCDGASCEPIRTIEAWIDAR